MPSVVKSFKWFVRVDGNKEDLTSMCKEVKGWIDTKRMLALYHTGETKENPHIHFVIELTSEIQKQSFDIRIKKVFKIEKKSQYSTKVWDGEHSACSYMFHESPHNIICNKDFTSEELDKFKELNESIQKVVELNKSRAPGRQVDRVVEEFRGDQNKPTRKDIFVKFMEKIRMGEMYEPGDYQITKYVEEAYMKTRGKDEWDDYVDERFHKLFLR